jgi:type I restriction-modification system DNA methylase subunit
MDEIRLYRSSSMERYESFRIGEIASNSSEFDRFFFLFSRQNLLPQTPAQKSTIDAIYDKNLADQAEINKKFYGIYSQARQNIYEHLTKDNPNQDRLLLIEKVQKILDRFLFMCFCEDKGYIGNIGENDPLTRRIFVNAMDSFSGSMWNEFIGIARAIDKGAEKPIKIPSYNGGLFEPDPELDRLHVDNEVFAHLKPLSDFDFESELDVNILGHVFEQSVSDIEELKASINNESFEKKKGKRKKQGIYYTPAYITGFIIEQTIGAWIERLKGKLDFRSLPVITEEEELLLLESNNGGKTKLPKDLKEKAEVHGNAWTSLQESLLGIKVLDPACGSGAFLNRAFQYLVKQHAEIYSQRKRFGTEGNLKGFDMAQIDYHVAKNNLFGVDLSKESVEITKLSLWLQLVYHKEKLPALEGSIHYGDSIVSDPNYSKAAFDWQGNFPNILLNPSTSGRRCPKGTDEGVLDTDEKQPHPNPLLEGEGGFDVVIGNPPYVRQEFLSPIKPALQTIYGSFYNGVADLYTYFYRRGFQLLKPGGYLGFITSSTFTKTGSGANLREFLKSQTTIDRFVDFGDLQLFGDATNYPCIVIARNTKPDESHKVAFSGIEVLPDLETSDLLDNATQVETLQNQLGTDAWNFDRPEVEALRTKIFSKGKPLKEIVGSPLYGIKTGLNEAFIIDKSTRDRLIKEELEQRNKQPHPNPLLKGEGDSNNPSPLGRRCPEGTDEGVSSVSSPTGRGEGEGVSSILNDGLSFNSHPLIKPFLVGRDLKQWHYDFADKYLIAIQKGFTKQWAGKDIDEAEAWKVLQANYPAIANQLKAFEEKARKRQDQGDFWWELRACEYYKAFEEPKIVYPDISTFPRISISDDKSYTDCTSFLIPNGSYDLLSIFMSKMFWFQMTKIAASLQPGTFRFKRQFIENALIVEPQGSEDDPATDKGKLALLAKTAQDKAFKRLEYRKGFLSYINDILNTKSAMTTDDDDVSEGSAINRWDTLSWNEFIKSALYCHPFVNP